MDLISHIPGVGPVASFTPGATTPAPYNTPQTGALDGVGTGTATKNVAEIYNRDLLWRRALIASAGLAFDPANWVQEVQAVKMIAAAEAQTMLGAAVLNYGSNSLPTTNIGPIWHDTYNSVMTWQSFTANGANYTGYASVNVGGLLLDTQPTARQGYVKSGASNLSRTAYAALRGWALHNGLLVASNTWAAGAFVFKDNADGTTFTVADVRGEFPRFWDDGRGVDTGRVFGSSQADDFKSHVHTLSGSMMLYGTLGTPGSSADVLTLFGTSDTGSTGGTETRPRNVALLACIKY